MGSEGELFEPGDLVETDPALLGMDTTIIPQSGVGVVVHSNPRKDGLLEVLWDGHLYLLHRDWVAKVKGM
jgi:hypothetical protein